MKPRYWLCALAERLPIRPIVWLLERENRRLQKALSIMAWRLAVQVNASIARGTPDHEAAARLRGLAR